MQKESRMGEDAPANLCEDSFRPTVDLFGLNLTIMTSGIGKINTISFEIARKFQHVPK